LQAGLIKVPAINSDMSFTSGNHGHYGKGYIHDTKDYYLILSSLRYL